MEEGDQVSPGLQSKMSELVKKLRQEKEESYQRKVEEKMRQKLARQAKKKLTSTNKVTRPTTMACVKKEKLQKSVR